MSRVGRARPPGSSGRLEHMIEALIPPDRRRPTPPAPLPVTGLPRLRSPAPAALFVLDMARMDASGRFTSAPLLRALGWRPGRPVELTAQADAVTFTATAQGRTVVGARGELAVPAPARVSAGLDHDTRVVLVAIPSQARLIVHPPALLAGLLAAYYAREPGDDR